MATFPNSVARVWPLWLEGRCQASSVKVVVGDLFATPNLLKSHTERNLLSPIKQHPCRNVQVVRVSESGDCRRPLVLNFFSSLRAVAAASFNPASIRSHSPPYSGPVLPRDLTEPSRFRTGNHSITPPVPYFISLSAARQSRDRWQMSQQGQRVRRADGSCPQRPSRVAAFEHGLRELGWVK
jgi:hypothetical protein